MLTTEEDGGGIDGIRCAVHEDVVAFRLKWAAQLLNELFQVRHAWVSSALSCKGGDLVIHCGVRYAIRYAIRYVMRYVVH